MCYNKYKKQNVVIDKTYFFIFESDYYLNF